MRPHLPIHGRQASSIQIILLHLKYRFSLKAIMKKAILMIGGILLSQKNRQL
jgi:hypothetical protein